MYHKIVAVVAPLLSVSSLSSSIDSKTQNNQGTEKIDLKAATDREVKLIARTASFGPSKESDPKGKKRKV